MTTPTPNARAWDEAPFTAGQVREFENLLTWRTDTAALTQLSTVPLSAIQSRTTWQLGLDFIGQPQVFFRVRATLRQ